MDFTAKQMLPRHISAKQVGGQSAFLGMDVDSNISDDNIKALHAAMKRAFGSPKWFRKMNQWFAVWERFCVVARCCSMLTETQLIHYKATICQLLEFTREMGFSFQRALLYDDMFRHQLAARAAAGDPHIEIGDQMQNIDKQTLRPFL